MREIIYSDNFRPLFWAPLSDFSWLYLRRSVALVFIEVLRDVICVGAELRKVASTASTLEEPTVAD